MEKRSVSVTQEQFDNFKLNIVKQDGLSLLMTDPDTGTLVIKKKFLFKTFTVWISFMYVDGKVYYWISKNDSPKSESSLLDQATETISKEL